MGETTTQTPVVPGLPPTLEVGVNYPWPYNWCGDHMVHLYPSGDAWVTKDLPQDLVEFRKHGVRVIRFWLLCQIAPPHEWGTLVPVKDPLGLLTLGYRVVPPPAANPKFFDALEKIFLAFQREAMQVIPCLLSFETFRDYYGIVQDPSVRKEFMAQVVTPMAEISAKYPATLHSWDVCNEIAWNIAHADISLMKLGVVGARAYLADAMAAIDGVAAAKSVTLRTSAGHAAHRDLSYLQRGAVSQFHFYPVSFPLYEKLPDYSGFPEPPVLGEISSNAGTGGTEAVYRPWPELNGGDVSSQYEAVNRRLWAANDKGYRLVLLWPSLEDKLTVSARAPQKFSPDVWRAVDDFRKGIRA